LARGFRYSGLHERHNNLVHRRELPPGDRRNRPVDAWPGTVEVVRRLGWRRAATADVKSSTVRVGCASVRLVVSSKGDECFPPRISMWSVSSQRSVSVRTACGPDSVRRIQEPVAPTWGNPPARKAVEGEVNAWKRDLSAHRAQTGKRSARGVTLVATRHAKRGRSRTSGYGHPVRGNSRPRGSRTSVRNVRDWERASSTTRSMSARGLRERRRKPEE